MDNLPSQRANPSALVAMDTQARTYLPYHQQQAGEHSQRGEILGGDPKIGSTQINSLDRTEDENDSSVALPNPNNHSQLPDRDFGRNGNGAPPIMSMNGKNGPVMSLSSVNSNEHSPQANRQHRTEDIRQPFDTNNGIRMDNSSLRPAEQANFAGSYPSQRSNNSTWIGEPPIPHGQQNLPYQSTSLAMYPPASNTAQGFPPIGMNSRTLTSPGQIQPRGTQDELLLNAQREREIMRLQIEQSQASSQAHLQYLINARRSLLLQNALQEDQQYLALLSAAGNMNHNSNNLIGQGMVDPNYSLLQQRMFMNQLAGEPTCSLYPPNIISRGGQHQQQLSSPLQMMGNKNNVVSNTAMMPDASSRSQSENSLVPHNNTPSMALGTEEDGIWLSDFLCFVRSHCVEVFTASQSDVLYRRNSKKISKNQVGIRCRFCCHLPHSERGGRSSSFPSSISRIYQSFTMMIRDHFSTCKEMPQHEREQYNKLKNTTTKGAMESKKYWVDSALSLGMVDTGNGIFFKKDLSSEQPLSNP